MSGQLGTIPYPIWEDDPNTQWQRSTPQAVQQPGSVARPAQWPWWPGDPSWYQDWQQDADHDATAERYKRMLSA